MHQTARTACRATAGHIKTPTSLTVAAAFARTAPAAQLYSSIATTNPRQARLGPSSRASQQAPPNESSAAPAMRPTIKAAGVSSDTPSNNRATSGGDNSKVNPTAASANAVTTSSFPVTTRCTNNSEPHRDPWLLNPPFHAHEVRRCRTTGAEQFPTGVPLSEMVQTCSHCPSTLDSSPSRPTACNSRPPCSRSKTCGTAALRPHDHYRRRPFAEPFAPGPATAPTGSSSSSASGASAAP
jgi:hypothetical protein